jgi:hypothetical protein
VRRRWSDAERREAEGENPLVIYLERATARQ